MPFMKFSFGVDDDDDFSYNDQVNPQKLATSWLKSKSGDFQKFHVMRQLMWQNEWSNVVVCRYA